MLTIYPEKGYDTTQQKKEYPGHDTKLYLEIWVVWIILHWSGAELLVRVKSMDQINILK